MNKICRQKRRILTTEGPLTFERKVLKVKEDSYGTFLPDLCDRACTDPSDMTRPRHNEIIPEDEYLGLGKLFFKMTHAMEMKVVYWAQDAGPFKKAQENLKIATGMKLSVDLIKRVTNRAGLYLAERDSEAGEKASEDMAKLSFTKGKKGTLYIEADGAMLNTTEKDGKGSSYKENKLGIVYSSDNTTAKKCKNGEMHVTINEKEYTTHFGKVDVFKKQLFACAIRNGYGLYSETVVISDGAEWLHAMCDEYFPDAVQILDYYHLAENINTFAKYYFKNKEGKYKLWAKKLCALAWEGKIDELLKILKKFKGKKYPSGIPNIWHYVYSNRGRINYKRFREAGYIIGSGAIESANKSITQARCKQAGMKWTVKNAQNILTLRTKWQSHLWNTEVRSAIYRDTA